MAQKFLVSSRKLQDEKSNFPEDLKSDPNSLRNFWKNISKFFSKHSSKDVAVTIVKEKSPPLRRFSSIFKQRKATRKPSSVHHPQFAQIINSIDGSDGTPLAMGVRLPDGVAVENLSFTIELEPAKAHKSYGECSQIHLDEEDAMVLKYLEENESSITFCGVVAVPSNTKLEKLKNIPLYVMDSREKLLITASSEASYRTVIKPSTNILETEFASQLLVNELQIKLILEKISGNCKTSKQSRYLNSSKRNTFSSASGASKHKKFSSGAFQGHLWHDVLVVLFTQASNNELKPPDTCALEEQLSASTISVTSSNHAFVPEDLFQLKASNPQQSTKSIGIQHSTTNLFEYKSIGVQFTGILDSFLSPVASIQNPRTLKSPGTSSGETLWPESQTTSASTGHSSTLLSFPSNIREDIAGLIVPTNFQSDYYKPSCAQNSKTSQTDSKQQFQTVKVGVMIDAATETGCSDVTLNLLHGARLRLRSYLSESNSSSILDDDFTQIYTVNDDFKQGHWKQGGILPNSLYEYYESKQHIDVPRMFEEKKLSGNTKDTETKNFTEITKKLEHEIDNMKNLYKEVFDGVNKALGLSEMIQGENIQVGKIEEINTDLTQTFVQLKNCLHQMDQVLNKNKPSEEDKSETYNKMEAEIQRTIQELLKESKYIKEVVILSGGKEEHKPPFSEISSDPHVFCVGIVNDIIDASLGIIQTKNHLDDTGRGIDIMELLLHDCGPKPHVNPTVCSNFQIGDAQNKLPIKREKVYFNNIASKVLRTSYAFGEVPKDKKRLSPKSKSPVRRRNLNENLRLIEELCNLNVLEMAASSNPVPNPPSKPGSDIHKAPKQYELGKKRNLPSTSSKLYKMTSTTDEEEEIGQVEARQKSEDDSGRSGISNCRKRAFQESETTSDDGEVGSSERRPRAVDLEVMEFNYPSSSSDTCHLELNENQEALSGNSHIGLRPIEAAANLQQRFNEHTEEPGRNPNTTARPRQLELFHSDHNYTNPETFELPRPKIRFRSVQEMNTPEEITAIEKNVLENERLKSKTVEVCSEAKSYTDRASSSSESEVEISSFGASDESLLSVLNSKQELPKST